MAHHRQRKFPTISSSPFTFTLPDDTATKGSPNSPTISSSDKENSPIPQLVDASWTNAATDGSDTTPEDADTSDADAESKLPTELSYDAFIDFCKIPDQRAQLWDELKDGAAAGLCEALTVFHETYKTEKLAIGLRQRANYTRACLDRLNDSLRGLQPLVFTPSVPIASGKEAFPFSTFCFLFQLCFLLLNFQKEIQWKKIEKG